MIDRATIDKIMAATNIVDVVSEFVTLRKRGVNYVGLCPFHNDTHPSFSVSPSRGICHCFTCGKGGNAVHFLMELEQMTYPEALRWLARKYNIEIHEKELTPEEKREEGERESMFIVNEWAAKYFQNILHQHPDGKAVGMAYFRSRGFRDDIISRFQLGFALPQQDAMSSEAVREGYQPEFLKKTGLSYEGRDGHLKDRFAGRALFPWISVSGKVIAFGGRVLDKRTKGVSQKYVNSLDSPIYHKEKELYGIYQAKKSIARENLVYMVEGYTDVISMNQSGIENVVANSGTALSVCQIRLLHRFTNNIVLLYDGDAAGIHAALRGTDMLLKEGMNVKVLLLPDGNDPDSFARSHTAADFKSYVEGHQEDFIEFKIRVLLKGVSDPIKRSEAINSIVESVSVITDQIVRATYIHLCSARLGLNESTLIRQMNQFIRNGKSEQEKAERRAAGLDQHSAVPAARPQIAEPAAISQKKEVEQQLIQLVIRHGNEKITVQDHQGKDVTLPVAQYVDADLSTDQLLFSEDIYNQILHECVEHLKDTGFESENYFINHPNPKISQLAARMCTDRFHLSESLKVEDEPSRLAHDVLTLILNFRLDYVEHYLDELKRKITESTGDSGEMKLLIQKYQNLQTIRNQMAKMLGSNILV
ncbi:MAG: DNA primase [Prevotella sp.]|jgi:DNA primase|nr:DNA primase [Prevotella sp.]MCI1684485.1 DNA primase [Prevotella sp.]MCI1780667.1 DNA primase [Prevotella sp.]MCI1803147.1 DNA primase [Prevotella sp.]MCI1817420.1 DNA primase [Prevotella sp.]MCI1848586.1 DNA primase [Prevotella sp.]